MQLVCDTEPIGIMCDESEHWDWLYVIKKMCYKLLPRSSSGKQGGASREVAHHAHGHDRVIFQ
jgi:hypothetical protein